MTSKAALAGGAVLTAVLLIPPAPAAAAPGDPGAMAWAVRPAGPKGPSGRDYFGYSLSPGQTVRDKVSISNLSDRARTFRVYATDAFTTADGSFGLLTADRTPTGVGTWVTIERGSYTVKAGRTVQVPFTLKVPHDATPGDHGGGIVASVTEQRTTARGQRVNVDRRVAARVYLRAAGALAPALQVTALRTGYDAPLVGNGRMDVTYTVRNTGNLRMTALARIGAQGPFGLPLGEQVSRGIPELLPGGSYTFTERIGGVPPAGRLAASVRLSPTDPQTGRPVAARPVARKASLWHVPWLIAGAVAVLAAGAVYARRRRPRSAR
ncbi:DUF916 domain-containing protein [Actinomadura sp. NAK00032]|uniref:WxL protein peptidoglycan domain-containing protein n=1 Tax=Actinomadura sp. NAK00032 TaxID=2742128 RepID=UPI001590E797|nr:DUF916 domain-containing protein [Actinomadura sp. NAK00032]QKW38056.1 DUF916 domain-containing protein [Actinomadura sp. NAK00032]